MSLNTTPSTWVASAVLTAAQLNLQVRDALTGIQAAWTAYTPTSTGITLGNGTLTGRSNRMGKTIDFTVVFTLGSTSAVSAAPTFTLPFTARVADWVSMDCTANDSSVGITGYYPFAAIATSTTVVTFRPLSSTAGNPFGTVGAAAPFTWGTGDIMSLAGRYEAA